MSSFRPFERWKQNCFRFCPIIKRTIFRFGWTLTQYSWWVCFIGSFWPFCGLSVYVHSKHLLSQTHFQTSWSYKYWFHNKNATSWNVLWPDHNPWNTHTWTPPNSYDKYSTFHDPFTNVFWTRQYHRTAADKRCTWDGTKLNHHVH